jgi:metallophosphoesterase (TIGR03767 family)
MSDNADESGAHEVSRRRMLGLGAAAAGAVAAGSLLGSGGADAAPTTAAPAAGKYPIAPTGTTLARTLLHGTPSATSGYRHIVPGAGEKSHVRGELLDGATRRSATRTPLVAFCQLTDMHVVDAQSPLRVEFLDRFNDPGTATASVSPFSAAYRPWEMLTAHVAEAMVQSVNKIAYGPVTGHPLDFTISTGDNSDNTQYNEVRWHINLLDGHQRIRPDSGDYTKWEGVGGPTDLDTAYWHPDGTPPLGSIDHYRSKYGYPTVPGLLDACRAPFATTGLKTPWYSVFGNHDGLLSGNIPPNSILNAVATGSVKVTGLPDGVNAAAVLAALAAGDFTTLEMLLSAGPAKVVTPDSKRRSLSLAENVAQHFVTKGTPVGHGYTKQNVTDGTAYYTFTKGRMVGIVLDTVNPNGYDDGSIDETQRAWLVDQLRAHSSRRLTPAGTWLKERGTDKIIVIFSHHTVATMENTLGTGRVNGTTVASTLLQYPNVVAWVNGHTHVNSVTPHERPAGTAVGGGFWEINTASHVDWPQQSRLIEIVDNGDRTISIFGTIIDHAAPTAWSKNPTTPLELAALSRELAVNDPQRDPETATTDGKRGTVTDRNVELLLRKPF